MELLGEFPGHSVVIPTGYGQVVRHHTCQGLVFFRDQLVSAGDDGTMIVMNLAQGTARTIGEPWVYREGKGDRTIARAPIDCIAISSGGALVAGSVFDSIQVWELSTGKLRYSIGRDRPPLVVMDASRIEAIRPTGFEGAWPMEFQRRLGLSSDVSPTFALACWERRSPHQYRRIAFLQGEEAIVASGRNGTEVWDAPSGQLLIDIPDSVLAWVAPSPRPESFAVAVRGEIEFWSVRDRRRVRSVEKHVSPVVFCGSDECMYTSIHGMLVCLDTLDLSEKWRIPNMWPGGDLRLVSVGGRGVLATTYTDVDIREVKIWTVNPASR